MIFWKKRIKINLIFFSKLKNENYHFQNRNFEMASKYLQKFSVPDNFYEILHDFAREVIRDQPEDITEYGSLFWRLPAVHPFIFLGYYLFFPYGKPFIYEGKYNIKRTDQNVHKEHNPERIFQKVLLIKIFLVF